jgi:hypothetical protein
MLTSPFSSLSKKAEKKLTFFLVIATIFIGYFMLFFDSFLTNEVCENGIISFQLAKHVGVSEAILNSWNNQSKISAGLNTGLDFLFLIIYPSLIALLVHKLNRKLWSNHSFYSIGIIVLFTQFFAALFDAIENIGLTQLLLGNITQFWTSIAYYFAIAKFILLAIGILYIIINFIIFIIKKVNKNEQN